MIFKKCMYIIKLFINIQTAKWQFPLGENANNVKYDWEKSLIMWLLFQLYFNHQQDYSPYTPNESDPTYYIQKETFHAIPFHSMNPFQVGRNLEQWQTRLLLGKNTIRASAWTSWGLASVATRPDWLRPSQFFFLLFFSLCVLLMYTATHVSVLQNGCACLWVSMHVLPCPINPPIEIMLHLGSHRVTALGCIHSLEARSGLGQALELVWTHPDVGAWFPAVWSVLSLIILYWCFILQGSSLSGLWVSTGWFTIWSVLSCGGHWGFCLFVLLVVCCRASRSN